MPDFPDAKLLEVMRTMQIAIDIRIETFGTMERAAIMGCVIVGTLEGRDWDLSSLASRLQITRPTVTRMVQKLEHEGFISTEKKGHSQRIHATQKALNKVKRAIRLQFKKFLLAFAQIERETNSTNQF